MSGILDGKVAVVTGGGAGQGEAMARLFAREGCKVVVADIRKELTERVAEEIFGLATGTDISVESEVADLFESCDKTYGRLDILVNNAGIPGPIANVEDMQMADWDEIMGVNVRGLIMCTKYAVPLLKRQGGSIVNNASLMGLRGATPMRSPYAASKFAVLGITESIAQELGIFGVRVNALCPGAVNGEWRKRVVAKRAAVEGKSEEEIMRSQDPVEGESPAALRRKVEPEEVAATALFLVSDAASAITGEHIRVDAGRK